MDRGLREQSFVCTTSDRLICLRSRDVSSTASKTLRTSVIAFSVYFRSEAPLLIPRPQELCTAWAWRLHQDPSCDWRDDTAGAIAACGLIELSKVTKNWKKQKYMDAAIRLLKAIDEKGCNYDPNVDELLEKCTAAYNEPDHNFPMIYADYYFIEAIWKLTGDELFIW